MIKVSVCMITFNHEKYIAQAIDGVMMQKTNFAIELVIGEDCSTDNTASIVMEYVHKYPEKIKARFNAVNIGMQANFLDTIQRCEGEFLAMCEGDDYWTDPLKLQKQVDFLSTNDEFSFCFHSTKIWDEKKQSFFDHKYIDSIPDITDISDLAKGHYAPTQTVMYRRNDSAIRDLASFKTPMTDYPLAMLHARYGKIKKLPGIMSVYRIHDGGCYQGEMNYSNMEQSLRMLEEMTDFFNEDIVSILHLQYFRIAESIFDHYTNSNDFLIAEKIINDGMKIDKDLAHSLLINKIIKLQNELTSIKRSKILKTYNAIKYGYKKLFKNIFIIKIR